MNESELTLGRVFIGSKKMRGPWASRPDGALTVDVTSAQRKDSPYRKDFSPMHLAPYEGFACFENYWQGHKVYEGIAEQQSLAWWRALVVPKRRYPAGKGKRVLHSNFGGILRNYLQSRKEIYVPLYHAMMVETPSFTQLKARVEEGQDVVIMDFDGPKGPQGELLCEAVTLDLLQSKINDEQFPFGHGYVIAAALAGIPVDQFTA